MGEKEKEVTSEEPGILKALNFAIEMNMKQWKEITEEACTDPKQAKLEQICWLAFNVGLRSSDVNAIKELLEDYERAHPEADFKLKVSPSKN